MNSYQFQAQMPSASTLFSAYASISALAMLLRSIIHEFIPAPIRDFLLTNVARLFHRKPTHLTLVIEEIHTNGIGRNQVYDAAEAYLTTKLTTPSTNRLKISKSPKDKSLTVRFHMGETIDDSYEDISDLRWRFVSIKPSKRGRGNGDDDNVVSVESEKRYFELILDKEHKDKVINSYIPYIISKYNSMLEGERTLKLCTLGGLGSRGFSGYDLYWDSVNLQHPFTFDTLAMDPDQKNAIMDDLDRFLGRKEFYRKVGRAWKRGYLLYGPPGTGKSSLIAAMANYLRFDIYDLQLGNWMKDSELRRLLLAIANRSILVIEDIDCSVELTSRHDNGQDNNNGTKRQDVQQLTLSGLLNFIDGLWSSCGDQRIIIFTTNHKEKLDPALLRPGRMDMHIHMSYLTVQGFRILATNYLGLKDPHFLSGEIENLIESMNVTPAEVAEELMRTENVDKALEGVLELLNKKKKKEMVFMENQDVNGTIDSCNG